MIKVNNIRKSYQTGSNTLEVLKGVNMEIESGLSDGIHVELIHGVDTTTEIKQRKPCKS